MSTVIKNGTVVTADLSYEADVLVEGGKIVEIGKGLTGDEELLLAAREIFETSGPDVKRARTGGRPIRALRLLWLVRAYGSMPLMSAAL